MVQETLTPLITPLQTPRSVNTNTLNIKAVKASESVGEIKKLIPINYDHLRAVFMHKFQSDNAEECLIFKQFASPTMLDLIRNFMAYIMLYDEEKGYKRYTEFFEQIHKEINVQYRGLIVKLLGKIVDHFKILVMVAYFAFYFLVDMEFYDLSANHMNFLAFCLEVVHYELTGTNIQPDALRKTLVHKFKNNYKVPKTKKSLFQFKIGSTAFDKVVRTQESNQMRKSVNKFTEAENFKDNIQTKICSIPNGFKSTLYNFKDDLETYNKNKDKSFEYQHVKFRMMKRNKFISQDSKNGHQMAKYKLNINSMSKGMMSTTFNPKKKHYISKVTRGHPGRH